MRIGYVVKLLIPGLWGIGKRGFEADVLTSKCLVGDKEVPCIPSTAMKGVLRKAANQISKLLNRVGVISDTNYVNRLFGSEGWCYTPITLTDLVPIESMDIAKKAFEQGYHILIEGLGLKKPDVSTITHTRIDDASLTVSKEALYSEERVVPETLMYGEIMVNERLLREVLRVNQGLTNCIKLLLFALNDLKYRYVGRKSIIDVAIIGIKPMYDFISKDPHISSILNKILIR
ncbi:MAG TPA: hypothetical protein ENF75_04295 [Acidilobales archaeon]|nr:hypothetical protein [Acidilobales archaeon]